MATIINQTYFSKDKAQLKLPIDQIPTQDYIDREETDILDKVLGVELSDEFTDALDAGSPAQKWLDLRDGKKYTDSSDNQQRYKGIQQIIADYVYVKATSDKQDYPTDSGIKRGNTENAENTSPRYRQVWADSDMNDRIFHLDGFINATNNDTADTYENYLPTKQIRGNIFNI